MFVHGAESLQDRNQHQAGWPGVLHVSAEVPATGLRHADDPPCPVPRRRSNWWGENREAAEYLQSL